ncbi:MAG: ParA family protein, partial [Mycobacterium sp.]
MMAVPEHREPQAVSSDVSRETWDSHDADTPIGAEAERAVRLMQAATQGQLPRPARQRVFTIANQKGGVGKTTTAVNIAAALALQGLRTLVIDLDPQGNASTALGIEHRPGTPSSYEVLIGEIPVEAALQRSPHSERLFCIPATIDLAGAEIELVSMVAREGRLRGALAELRQHDFDYVFIDCPPSLGLLTINALVAAPEVLIPIQCEYYALEGLSQLLNNIQLIEKHLNPQLKMSTILLTMFDGRTNLANQVAQEVREHFPNEVLGPMIPRSVRISEAP